ncbi:MAG: hypothetical protein AAF602_07025 [Myxococcota bacterium]
MIAGLALALLAGCPKGGSIVGPAVNWEEMPRLPSPSAGSYARVRGTPPDPGVRSVLGLRGWDASLGGTAAGLALNLVYERGGLTPPEIREAAWRAGWPFPVRSVHTVGASIGAEAPSAVRSLVSQVPGGVDMGLVRARGDQQDIWVLVTSEPRIDLQVFPRQLPKGARLKLPAQPGVRFAVADPVGQLFEGHLELEWSTEVDQSGEWLVELRDAQGVAARFPVYVGMVPPDLSLLSGGDPPVNDPVASDQAYAVIDRVREAYGLREPQVDTLLQSAVPWAQLNPSLDPAEIAKRVGIDPDDLWRMSCSGGTVEICLDPIIWDPKARPALLSRRLLMGIGADVQPSGVRLTLLMARES